MSYSIDDGLLAGSREANGKAFRGSSCKNGTLVCIHGAFIVVRTCKEMLLKHTNKACTIIVMEPVCGPLIEQGYLLPRQKRLRE